MAQYSCKWNSHAPHLLGSMDNLRGVDNFVDVTLVSAGGRQLKAHRLVLSTCSEMLHQMFLQHPSQHTVVVLADVAFPTLRRIVDFAYRGEVSFPEAELEPLLKAATALQIKALTDVCREKWMSSTTVVESEESEQVVQKRSSPKRKRPRRPSRENDSEDEEHQEEPSTLDVVMEVEHSAHGTEKRERAMTTIVEEEPNFPKDEQQIKEALRSLCHTKQIKVKAAKALGNKSADRLRSFIWNFFTPVDSVYATCKSCKKNISRKSSISNLKKHLENKHGNVIMDTYSSEIVQVSKDPKKEDAENDDLNESDQAANTIISETVVYEENDQLYYVPTTQESEPGQSMPIILKIG